MPPKAKRKLLKKGHPDEELELKRTTNGKK